MRTENSGKVNWSNKQGFKTDAIPRCAIRRPARRAIAIFQKSQLFVRVDVPKDIDGLHHGES